MRINPIPEQRWGNTTTTTTAVNADALPSPMHCHQQSDLKIFKFESGKKNKNCSDNGSVYTLNLFHPK